MGLAKKWEGGVPSTKAKQQGMADTSCQILEPGLGNAGRRGRTPGPGQMSGLMEEVRQTPSRTDRTSQSADRQPEKFSLRGCPRPQSTQSTGQKSGRPC